MPCVIGCLALVAPRVLIVVLSIFTRAMDDAYETVLWPVLGFFLAPYTTLAYCWAMNAHGSVEGWWMALIVFTALVDLGSLGGGGREARSRRW
jgi:hypothetical protein